MIIPYQVDVPMQRWPIANWVIIGVTSLMSLSVLFGGSPASAIRGLALDGWGVGMFTHVFGHLGLIHLIGNMVFLWTFGNAVCAKVGNLQFVILYFVLAFASAAAHLAFDGHPAIGASGAINGVVGMYIMWYPLNNVSCAYWIVYRAGTFHVSSVWMITWWLLWDIWGAVSSGGGVAYWGHIGGFAAGLAIAYLLLTSGRITMTDTERSLRDIFAGRRDVGRSPGQRSRR